MRTFVLFALALAGLALVTDDVSAGPFRRKGAASNCDCGSGGYAYGGSAYPDTPYGSGYGAAYPGMSGMAYAGPATGSMGGRVGSMSGYTGPSFDGTSYYVPGRDGRYYSTTTGAVAPAGQMMSGQMMTGQMTSGKAAMIRTTDGQSYALGADGNYYPASAMSAMGGFAQPYPGTMSRSFYPSGVYPAGSYGTFNGNVYPAGGTAPLTMPGTQGVVPSGGAPAPMPRDK